MVPLKGVEEWSILNQQGYLLIKKVIPSANIVAARKLFDDCFQCSLYCEAEFDNEGIQNDIYLHMPALFDLLFTRKLMQRLKSILGDHFCFIPECAVHRNRYFDWHRDTSSQEASGHHFHLKNSEPLYQLAIYFQNNGIHGGGLTLIPETQTLPDDFLKIYHGNPYQKAVESLKKKFGLSALNKKDNHSLKIDVPTQVGDVLLFDLRIDHRATRKNHDKITEDKYAVFNTVGRKDAPAEAYQNYLRTRPEPYYRKLRIAVLPDLFQKLKEEYELKLYY